MVRQATNDRGAVSAFYLLEETGCYQGVLQGVFLCEHRDGGGFGCNLNRSVVLTLQGVDDR